MRKVIVILFLFFSASCQHTPTPVDVEANLKSAMSDYLTKHNGDSGKVKFDVKTVTYFDEKTRYNCEFDVKETMGNWDTTGSMGAWISKDFTKVERKY